MRRTLFPALVGIAAVALLAGCARDAVPSDARSAAAVDPTYLLSQAKANARAASSVHVRGTGQCDLGNFVVDMDLRKDGLGAGSVQVGGQTIDLVSTHDAVFMHGARRFWLTQVAPADADRIGSRWVKVAKGASPCLTALSDYSLVMANYLDYPGTPTLLEGTSMLGTPARLVGLGPDVSIWVASSGTLLPVNVHDVSTNTDITWSAWSSDPAVVVPRAGTVVDGSTLSSS